MRRSSGSTLSSSQMIELLTITLRPSPVAPLVEAYFIPLYPGSYSFGHDPCLMIIGEGQNIDGPENRELYFLAHLFLHHNRLEQRLHYYVKENKSGGDVPHRHSNHGFKSSPWRAPSACNSTQW
ncbi:hypothetical protein XENOCAPTIV_014873 [Xenoophorus captivus]|uniref:Uncharacterized protein n=1 Tax=Xenoophorus captivus TaxID=1517983 RepID=A0ABV0QIB8_9TELE